MNDKPRILFVDDQPEILRGLQRMLRRERDRWELAFAGSAEEALARLAETPCDVIVTDMRMPDMDGADLLGRVAEQFPDVIRFVLSGQADREAVQRSLRWTHQFLTKPCAPEQLKEHLDRALRLKRMVNHEPLRRIVAQIDTLPSLPTLYQEICTLAHSERSGMGEVARVVARDVGMSAKVLQLVNSSFYGLGREIADVKQAVALLGMETIKSLALSVGAFRGLNACRPPKGFSVERFWDHASAVGAVAKRIVMEQTGDEQLAEAALTAGLLHDVGKLVMLVKLPELFEDTLQTARAEGRTFYEVEMECEGVSHAQIGAYLLGIWRLPMVVIDAVAHHHELPEPPSSSLTATLAVHAANVIVQEYEPGQSGNGAVPQLAAEHIEAAGLSDALSRWRIPTLETC